MSGGCPRHATLLPSSWTVALVALPRFGGILRPETAAMHLIADHLTVDRGGRRVLDGLAFSVSSGTALVVTAWAPTALEAIKRMDRAVREFRIRGVATNLTFLENIIGHPKFQTNQYTTRFIDETPELFQGSKRKDRATKLLSFIADVTVNGHPEVRGRVRPSEHILPPSLPEFPASEIEGTKKILDRFGPTGFAQWLRGQKRVMITDTSMRDAHQSLLATRMRTYDLAR
eukprot:gene22117-23168_t